jgi:hypothetical protein
MSHPDPSHDYDNERTDDHPNAPLKKALDKKKSFGTRSVKGGGMNIK